MCICGESFESYDIGNIQYSNAISVECITKTFSRIYEYFDDTFNIFNFS